MEVTLRRYQRMLIDAGAGVILLSAWNMIRTILYYILNKEATAELIKSFGIVEDEKILTIAFFVVIVFFMSLDLLLRLFVGLSARSDGFGKKKHTVYIGVAILMALFQLIATVCSVLTLSFLDGTNAESVVTFLVDLTALVIILELVVSAIYVRILRKRIARAKQEEAVCS